ncbi:hypothetical protein BC834DRAFT_973548 [Gloeopeniophorella convolvens]|nr:hypothetical protein BC834DRAFT_973548 [Gloeopeniophorella convolvens]
MSSYAKHVLALIPLAVIIYDYFLTLPEEVEFFWPPRNKLGFVSIVFLLNRYIALVGNLAIVRELFTYPSPSWSTVTGMGAGILQVTSIIPGCNQWVGQDAGRGLAITWGSLSAFDAIIFFMTLYKSLTFGRGGVRLLDVLMRDGTVFFTLIALVNIVNVMVLRFAPPLLRNSSPSLTNLLAAVMISRIMINLRAEHHRIWTVAQEMTTPTVVQALDVAFVSSTGLGDIRLGPSNATYDMC